MADATDITGIDAPGPQAAARGGRTGWERQRAAVT